MKNKPKSYQRRMTRLVRFITGWAWRQETDLAESVAILEELHVTPGAMEITVKQRPELAQWVGQCFAEMVASSQNYTEMRFDTRKPESWEWITVTVQKGTGKTPHTLRIDAEKERDELRAILESKVHEMAQPRIVRPLNQSSEAHRHLYHPWWSENEMEAIATLAHRHRMNPVELIRDAVAGWDQAWQIRHSVRYILEDANPEKLAEACGLPLGVITAALKIIFPNADPIL